MKGIIVFKSANAKSKSEGVFPYLYLGNGEFVKIRLEDANPFENEELKAFDTKKVIVEGEFNENNTFIATSIKEDCADDCAKEVEVVAKDVENVEENVVIVENNEEATQENKEEE